MIAHLYMYILDILSLDSYILCILSVLLYSPIIYMRLTTADDSSICFISDEVVVVFILIYISSSGRSLSLRPQNTLHITDSKPGLSASLVHTSFSFHRFVQYQ